MPKAQLKTLDDLRAALLRLLDDCDGYVEAKFFVVTTHTGPAIRRSESEFYGAGLTMKLDQTGGGFLDINETGNTPEEAYRNARLALARELEERSRKRRLTGTSIVVSALAAPAPKLLTHQS